MLSALLLIATLARPDSTLEQRIVARAAQLHGATIGLIYQELDGSAAVEINADTSFHAASTMKVPVMIELFRQADAGAFALEQPLLLVNRFGSIVDGSPYELDPTSDSDSLVYTWVGSRVAVRSLMERMIVRSSNLATNAVIALVGAERVTATAHALGASRIQVLRGVEDSKAYAKGLNNTTTARDLASLLIAIERGRAASPAACDSMRAILLRQEHNGEIPAGLPPGTRVAHKTGWITATLHDAAIVYPTGHAPYVLVVMTRGLPDEATGQALIADISRLVWSSRPR